METFYALLAPFAGNSPVTGDFPSQRPVTRSFDVFFYLHLNKRLSKQIETPLGSLWRHRNDRCLTQRGGEKDKFNRRFLNHVSFTVGSGQDVVTPVMCKQWKLPQSCISNIYIYIWLWTYYRVPYDVSTNWLGIPNTKLNNLRTLYSIHGCQAICWSGLVYVCMFPLADKAHTQFKFNGLCCDNTNLALYKWPSLI